jgi:hypothetical protein
LLNRAIIEIACLQNETILGVQFPNLAPQQAVKLPARVLIFRIRADIPQASVAASSVSCILFVEIDPMNAPFLAPDRNRCVDDNRNKPGGEAALSAELSNVFAGAEYGFLNCFVGFVSCCCDAAGKAIQHVPVAAEQLVQGARFSALGCDDEFFIAPLPTAAFNVKDLRAAFRFSYGRQFCLSFQLHFSIPMRPELAPSSCHAEQIVGCPACFF